MLVVGEPQAALQAKNYHPMIAVAGFGAMAVFGGFVALAARGTAFGWVMAALAVILGTFGVLVGRWAESITPRTVTIDPSIAGLRFVARRGTRAIFPVTAVLGLLPAVVSLVFELGGTPVAQQFSIGRWGPYGLGLLSLGWIVAQLVSLRTPPGLTITDRGLRGARGDRRVDLRWEELARVDVAGGDRGAKLLLSPVGCLPITIEPRWLGSDPNVVAPIIRHFLENPADRPLLAEPGAAIQRVEHALAAR
ncbi:hypothetical protein ITJ38_00420 [Agreia pratensis]|uniref:hypothetical protein n=1 Tax=Agreia pratensis TaxID=150121 RepID=UPI00188B8181|nr:hypothetical protein [Agreia pratensis]MBF4632864.1 hypothetical protein [Agreia pratensis]